MRQFFETYRDEPILSPLLRELPWSSNLHILSRSKKPEEREFYLKMASHNQWQVREVARQMDTRVHRANGWTKKSGLRHRTFAFHWHVGKTPTLLERRARPAAAWTRQTSSNQRWHVARSG